MLVTVVEAINKSILMVSNVHRLQSRPAKADLAQFTEMMAYVLDQEHADAWMAVQDLANVNSLEADKKLRRWVLEN